MSTKDDIDYYQGDWCGAALSSGTLQTYELLRQLLQKKTHVSFASSINNGILSRLEDALSHSWNREFVVQSSAQFSIKFPGKLTKTSQKTHRDWPYDRRPCEPEASGIIIWINLNILHRYFSFSVFFCSVKINHIKWKLNFNTPY